MKAYTHANWDRWQAEEPEWFTEEWIASIPEDFVPLGLKSSRVEQGRMRSSALLRALGLPDETYQSSRTVRSKKKYYSSSKVAPAEVGEDSASGPGEA